MIFPCSAASVTGTAGVLVGWGTNTRGAGVTVGAGVSVGAGVLVIVGVGGISGVPA